MYKFSLKFNSELEELGFDNGIPMNQLGDLISSLYSVVEAKKGDKVVLSDIKDNCYEIEAMTVNPMIEERLIHSSHSIYEKSNSELTTKELRFKKNLARVLKVGWYVDILNNEGNSVYKIPYGFNEKTIDNYYSNKSIEGVITEIGDKDLNPKNLHIYISDNTEFKIFINSEQHDELKRYYRDQRVRVKLRLKKSLESDKVLSAELISYKPKSKIDFPFNLNDVDLSKLRFLNE